MAAVFGLVSATRDAAAQDARVIEQARDAFDQGAAAYRRREYAQAADYFARADELVPSDEALEAAIDCATRADDGALAMRLADRSLRTASPRKGLADARRAAQERFRQKTGRIVVRCPTECSTSIDNKPIVAGVPTWTTTGLHSVTATQSDARDASIVEVKAERLTEVTLTPRTGAGATESPVPASEPAKRETNEPRGLSPTWVWIGAGATALLGGAAVFSGIQTLDRSDEFEKAGCEARGSDACDQIASSGRSAQLRTNLFAGGAGVAAAATVVLAVFVVDWRTRGPDRAAMPLRVGLGPGSVALSGTWP